MKDHNVTILCEKCGKTMHITGTENNLGVHYAHCLTRDCELYGKNSLIFAGKDEGKILAEDWLLNKFQEDDWRKKDALAWLHKIWLEYVSWLYENQ